MEMADRPGFRAMATLARLAARGLGRPFRLHGAGPAAGPAFEAAMQRLLADPSVAAQCRAARLVRLGPDGGWQPLGFDVQPGDEVTVLAVGGSGPRNYSTCASAQGWASGCARVTGRL